MVPFASTISPGVVEMDIDTEILTNEDNANKIDVHGDNAVVIIDGDDNEEEKQKKSEGIIKTS